MSEDLEHIAPAIGGHIESVVVDDDKVTIGIVGLGRLTIQDRGQSCCEKRYMTCDDDLAGFVGAEFLGAHVAAAPNAPGEYEEHEIEFLVIRTSSGDINIANHNEHNGYYGGFDVRADWHPAHRRN